MTGADRDWVTLANALGAENIRLTWAGIEGCEHLRQYLDARISARFVDLHFPPFNYLLWDKAYEERSTWLWTKILADYAWRLKSPFNKLRQVLKRDPVDIVVTNTAQVLLGAVLAQVVRRPHVWCVKECFDPSVVACRRFASWIVRMSTAVIVPSSAVARIFPASVHIFPDGNDVDRIRKGERQHSRAEVLQNLALPVERLVVAQAGGIFWLKGQHVTAEAFVRLATKNHPCFSLLFLGKSTSSYRERLDRILAHAPKEWRDAVRFLDYNPDDFSYLAAADIVVQPSVFPDSLPNAVREAMILGKPVIGSRDGGIPEMIHDGKTGLLVTPGDPDELAAALEHLLSSQRERERIGAAARLFANSQFDIQLRKQAFCDLLWSVTGERSRRHTRFLWLKRGSTENSAEPDRALD